MSQTLNFKIGVNSLF